MKLAIVLRQLKRKCGSISAWSAFSSAEAAARRKLGKAQPQLGQRRREQLERGRLATQASDAGHLFDRTIGFDARRRGGSSADPRTLRRAGGREVGGRGRARRDRRP